MAEFISNKTNRFLCIKKDCLTKLPNMRVVFFILSAVLILIICALLFSPKFKIMLVISERTKSAYYSVAHRLVSLTKGKIILLEDGSISVVDKKSILLEKRLPKELSKILGKNILAKISLDGLEVYTSGGKKDNPFLTAMASGVMASVFGAVTGVLKTKNIETDINARADFKDDNFTVAISSKIKISILNFIIVLIKSNKEYKKQLKEEEKAWQRRNA